MFTKINNNFIKNNESRKRKLEKLTIFSDFVDKYRELL